MGGIKNRKGAEAAGYRPRAQAVKKGRKTKYAAEEERKQARRDAYAAQKGERIAKAKRDAELRCGALALCPDQGATSVGTDGSGSGEWGQQYCSSYHFRFVIATNTTLARSVLNVKSGFAFGVHRMCWSKKLCERWRDASRVAK